MKALIVQFLFLYMPYVMAQEKQPNILFIMSDDHTSQAIGAYGGPMKDLNPTPNLDMLAADGLLFENAFCTNSICTPSRANILTGQYSQTNGVLDLDGTLPPEKQYLPIELKKLGYQTAIIGKWHLKEEPAAFDHYEVLHSQGDYFNPKLRNKNSGNWPQKFTEYTGYVSDVITDITIDYLQKVDKSKPFFLMHHHKAPHDMFEYPERYNSYLEEVDVPEPANLYAQPFFGSEGTLGRNGSLKNRIGTSVSSRHPYRNYAEHYGFKDIKNEDEKTHFAFQAYTKSYLRCVKGVDDNLGRLFTYLKQSGLWENTIIIYTSDQGMMLGEHDYIDKRWMYEESMRMPFIMRDSRIKTRGLRSSSLINNTDFAPTILEYAGGKTPEYMQGRSFAKLVSNPEMKIRNATYYRYWMHLTHHDIPAHFGIRTDRYKLIFYYGQHYNTSLYGTNTFPWIQDPSNSFHFEPTPVDWEFYDLQIDPYENVNRYKDERYQQIIANLKRELVNEREMLNETDEAYPHIQKEIERHWNK